MSQEVLRYLPFLTWFPRISKASLQADFIAGLTGAIIVLPQGVAFATIAGMPPEYGLYAGMIPAIIAALFGSSHHLVSGPTTAASVVLYASLSPLAEPGTLAYVQLALTLTFMVGAIQIVLGLARMGVLVNFISHSVVVGFTAGAAILIAAKQTKHFFGLDIHSGGHVHEIIMNIAAHLDETQAGVLAVGMVTLLCGIVVKRWFKRIPYMIAAMLAGSLAALVLQAQGVAGIKTVGALPASLPPFSAPDFSLAVWKELASAAFAVTLFALTEAVSIARALAARSGQLLDSNQEFIGQGMSNLAGSFFSGYVATGSFNRSGVNYEAGAQTPLAAVFAGGLLLIIVLLVAPLAEYLPTAAMAGILFLVAWGLIDFHHIRQIARTSGAETVVMGVTFLATLLLELEFAILLGVMLSLLVYLSRTAHPSIVPRAPNPDSPNRKFDHIGGHVQECPQLKIVRIDGSLFFGAVNHVQESLRDFTSAQPQQTHLALIMSGVNFIDMAGAEFLAQEAAQRRKAGGALYLIRVKQNVWRVLDKGGYLEGIGLGNVFQSKTAALTSIYPRLNMAVCAQCQKRIFAECAAA